MGSTVGTVAHVQLRQSLVHTFAREAGVLSKRGGSGYLSFRYSVTTRLSVRSVPSVSSKIGTLAGASGSGCSLAYVSGWVREGSL